MPHPAEKIFVLRGVLSFTRLSATLRLHVDHPVAWQKTVFSHVSAMSLLDSCFYSSFVFPAGLCA